MDPHPEKRVRPHILGKTDTGTVGDRRCRKPPASGGQIRPVDGDEPRPSYPEEPESWGSEDGVVDPGVPQKG